MNPFSVLSFVLLANLALAEKQIKLEDIEKDTLKSAQQAKYEKQLQQYQQYQQYQPQQYQTQHYQPQHYDQQLYSQAPQGYQGFQQAYQGYQGYSPYLLPQQYLQQPLFTGNYAALSANSIGQGYAAPPSSTVHPFQAYIGQQLAAGSPTGHPMGSHTQAQPIVMAISAPALAALQQQAYYHAVLPKMLSSLQYVPQSSQQQYVPQGSQQLYYSQQAQVEAPTAPQAHSGAVQYVPSFNPLPASSTKISPAFGSVQAQYVSTAPQSFSAPTYTGQSAYTPVYPTPTPYTPSQIYSGQDSPSFVSVKAPQHLLASAGQHSQYLQATTISPLQSKYLNSPHYLAQNYNTIQSSQLSPKSAFPVGIKSTVSPPLKIASTGGYLTSNPGSQGLAYQTYRNLQG